VRRYLALTCAALVAAPALAWAAPVRGVVVDEAGAPVAEAAVVIAGVEVTTDAGGGFAIDDVGAGTQDVLVVADGFEPLLTRAAPGRPLRLVLVRGGLVNDVELVTLEGEAPFVDEPAAYDLDPATVGTVAGAGNDALKAVQSLPGVARIPFGLGGLVLRGQSPRNSSVFLDGIEVPLLYHFGGLASFIPTPLLDGLEVMPGTFGARWGRTQGGVVEVRSRAARTDRWRGATEISLTDAQARGEGPLAGGGVVFGLRRSYIDGILAAAAPDLTLAPRYPTARCAGRGHATSRGGQWSALVFGSDDLLTFTSDPTDPMDQSTGIEYRSRFARAAVTWRRTSGPWQLAVAPSVGVDEVRLRRHRASSAAVPRWRRPAFTVARLATAARRVRPARLRPQNEPPRPGASTDQETPPTARCGPTIRAWTEGFYRWSAARLPACGRSSGCPTVVDPQLTLELGSGGPGASGATTSRRPRSISIRRSATRT
jgi:hypothetical protein